MESRYNSVDRSKDPQNKQTNVPIPFALRLLRQWVPDWDSNTLEEGRGWDPGAIWFVCGVVVVVVVRGLIFLEAISQI